MEPRAQVTAPPNDGLWRVGRSPDPLHYSDPIDPSLLDSRSAGNRFDSPTGDYRVCYLSSTLEGCFGETLARFRPNPRLRAVSEEEGFMSTGEVPADWRHRRLAVRATVHADEASPALQFLDVEAAATRAVLRDKLGDLLAYYGYTDLDVPTIRGGDRRITRWIGRWAHLQRDAQGRPLYSGIRYLSRLSSEWECWAIFENAALQEQERHPILLHDEALSRVVRLYGLTVF